MARSLMLDAKYQHFVTEQYESEARARLKFYRDTKEGRVYEPKTYMTSLPTIFPMQFALRKKRAEQAVMKAIIEEARAKQVKEEMWSVDADTKSRLYKGISRDNASIRDGAGRSGYLHERNKLAPDDKYTFPLLSSWQCGWKVAEEMDGYRRPQHGRTAKIQESFYSRNGLPQLRDPLSAGGVCARD